MFTCLKHFPGHGSSRADSHLGFTDVTDTWSEAELEPFAILIRAGLADMVMSAHVFHDELDPCYPATLSSAVIGGILRRRLEYDGVVVCDDLQMRAIADRFGVEEAAELALTAGANIIIYRQQPGLGTGRCGKACRPSERSRGRQAHQPAAP